MNVDVIHLKILRKSQMSIQPEDTKDAIHRLASGATIGMVDASLREKGLGSGPRAEVLDVAKRVINRRARIKHLLIGFVGILVLAGGGYWYYLSAINQNHRVKIPGVVMGAGLLLATYGLFNATQDKI